MEYMPLHMTSVGSCGVNHVMIAGINSVADTFSIVRHDSIDELKANGYATYLVDAATFILNLDFFLPNKKKTVVLLSGERVMTEGIMEPMLIWASDEPQTMVSVIAHCIETQKRIEKPMENDDRKGLSSREKEVLREVASGKTNKEIAEALNISVNTVITHRKNLTAKLGIRSASGLSLYALMNGII